ncbi:MAG TPA: fibronectin type III domain-containing protein, partial [Bacteroidia bacterium]|nr:fibronectin type III domain-containing protein [Bacteroidia bacterium]
VPNSKVALGVPYYGYDWPTTSAALNATTTASGTAVLYKSCIANAGTYGRKWDNYSMDPYYTYGSYHQCWYDDDVSLGYKYNMVNIQNIAGIGIWALGYDDGYSTAWTAIQNAFTTCGTVNCSGEFRDLGDTGNYYNNENWTWTLAPTSATAVSATFSSFNTTAGDILTIYNGPNTASPLIGNYQGTTSPGTVNGTTGSLTFMFKSSAAGTRAAGWKADWLCSGPGSCGPPIGLTASAITTTSATLNWLSVGGATSYNIQYKATSASTWTTVSTSALSWPLSGLSPGTSYEFQVQAVCSSTGNYSSPVSFSTNCVSPAYAILPYTTSFENTWISDSCSGGAQRVPDKYWRSSIGGTTPDGDDYWHRDDYTGADWTLPANGVYTPAASNGTYSARFHNDPPPAGSTGALDLYLDLSPTGTKTISFDYLHNEASPSPFAFNVLLSTDGGATFPTTLLTITTAQMATWTTQTVTTTATSATSVVRFIVTDKGTHDVGIDNLSITSAPTGIDELTNNVSLNVYPNPFKQGFTVNYTLPEDGPVTIYLVDLLGRKTPVHYADNETAGQHTINIESNTLNIAKGIYVLQLQTINGNSFFKIIAE